MVPVSKRTRTATVSRELDSCPVCFEPFGSGANTKVHPFECAGDRHAICRACDSTLFRRFDDRCVICRATRDLAASTARHGHRPSGTPVHLRQPNPPPFQLTSGTLFFSLDRPSAANSGPRVNILNPESTPEEAANFMARMLSGFSRDRPIDVDIEEEEPADPPAELASAISVIQSDPGIIAALRGLQSVADTPLGLFIHNMQTATRNTRVVAVRTRRRSSTSRV